MTTKRQIEIFSAGCPTCDDVVTLVNQLACPSCEITVVDMHNTTGHDRATQLGVKALPAVAVNGALLDCCTNKGVDESTLRAAGIGTAIT